MFSNKINYKSEGASLITGSIIALLIAISPYIFYLYGSFPSDEKVLETAFGTIQSRVDLNTAAWFFFGKLVPLYLLILWFFTCKNWWYHVLLIPISMYVFQLISVVNNDIRYIDEWEIYYTIPIMMIVIPLVYLVRIKIFDKVIHGIDLKKIDEELARYDALEKELEQESQFYQS